MSEMYSEFLLSHDLQLSFKSKMSCNHALSIMRKAVDYFVTGDSTINICSPRLLTESIILHCSLN